jgi:hypothetical protein
MENSYAEGIAVGVAILHRGQRYAEGLLRGLSRRPSTPTATTFGRRRSAQPSASSSIPVVLVGLDSIGNGGHGRGFGAGSINVNQVRAPAAPS